MVEFPVPQGVHTSVTYPELRLLQQYAHEAGTVLEIGTHFGFTCIGMALAGAHVTSVDPHFEGPANEPDTWEPFLANCERCGYDRRKPAGPEDACLIPQDISWESEPGCIYGFRMPIEEGPEFGELSPFGLVFIDGDHVWPAPMRDARIALAHLRTPGYVAFHDVTPNWPGVYRATRELTESGRLVKLAQVGTLAVYRAAEYVAVPPSP